ncbi:MAG TPA: M12 family metallo-peptidase [Acidimicrobiia bacterium]|nr:M12 family metallo-peptidase [Acidimicrobiia bacterium]
MRSPIRIAISAALVLTTGVVAAPAIAAPAPANTTAATTTDPWRAVSVDTNAARNGARPQISASALRTYTLDRAQMESQLATATAGSTATATIVLPTPAGTTQQFAVHDSPVMMPKLAAAHPELRTYVGQGVDDPTETVRVAMTPLGFTGSVRGTRGAWYVDSLYHNDQSVYASYLGRRLTDTHGPFVERESTDAAAPVAVSGAGPTTGATLRTFRLAVLTDPSFADYWGAHNTLAGLVTNLNRAEQIYNDELDVQLLLVDNEPNAQLNTIKEAFEPNGPCGGAACFSQKELAFCSGATLTRNRVVLGQLIGAENFDVGHVTLSNDGGGIADLGVVGANFKAEGCTGIPDADGDYYVVDYWAHEMGHEFDMNHTFDGNRWNCEGGNRNDATAVEPGSGSSIMAYAGICRQDNLQDHSDAYFSQRSDQETQAYMSGPHAKVTEVQTVSLAHFGGGDEVQAVTFANQPRQTNGFDPKTASFRVSIGDHVSALIGDGGEKYDAAGIQSAINAIPGFPGSVIVSAVEKTGFTVTYTDSLANTDVPNLKLADLSCGGCASGVDEVRHGGRNDSFRLSYAGGPASAKITYGENDDAAHVKAAVESILPKGATVAVAGFGGATGKLDNTGFQLTFGGTLAASKPGGSHVATLSVANASAGASGFVGKTAWGGPANNGGYSTEPTGNTPPVTRAPKGYTIPYRTPFSLTGHATDADGDTVTYMWEQNDPGTGTPLADPEKTNGALFRQFGTRLDTAAYDPHAYGSCAPMGKEQASGQRRTTQPRRAEPSEHATVGDDNGENCVTTNPTRVFPDMAQVLAGNTDAATGRCPETKPPSPQPLPPALIDCDSEWLPTSIYPGPLHFRLTARDGHPGAGGISSADTTVRLAPGSGPFLVTSQAHAVTYSGGSTQTVTWDVAGTDAAPIGTAKVDILLTVNGGARFTMLAANVANDGSQSVRLPDTGTAHARIQVRAVGNVFFAVNAHDFTITTRHQGAVRVL